MGWVRHPDGVTPDFLRAARFEIEIASERYPVEASLHAFYDPKSERMRA
jgi:glycine cleavage system aminomethyltransferase T